MRQRPPPSVSHTCPLREKTPRQTTPVKKSPWKITVVTLYALLARDLFAIAKFLVNIVKQTYVLVHANYRVMTRFRQSSRPILSGALPLACMMRANN